MRSSKNRVQKKQKPVRQSLSCHTLIWKPKREKKPTIANASKEGSIGMWLVEVAAKAGKDEAKPFHQQRKIENCTPWRLVV
jgi:hypothetical protein